MFRQMRLKKYETESEQALRILQKSDYGVLSVAGDNDYPYGIPVNHVLIKNAVYFHCALSGHKIDAIKRNPKVSFTAVSKTIFHPEDFNTEYASVILFGTAELVEGDEKTEAMNAIIQRYAPEFSGKDCSSGLKNTGIVRITVEHMSGKANYDGTI